MNSTRCGVASEAAQSLAHILHEQGGDNINDLRLMLQDLLGHPIPREASRALTAAIYHLDGVEAACNAIRHAIGG